MKPFCKVPTDIRVLFKSVPNIIPRFVRLVFPCDKAPVETTHFFQIEQREQFFYVIVQATRQPFGVDNRSTQLFQGFENVNIQFVRAVVVIGNDIGNFERVLRDFRLDIQIPRRLPYRRRNRLNGVDIANDFYEFFEVRQRRTLPFAVARFVVDVPN